MPRHVPVFDGVIYLPVFHGAGVDVIHTSAKKNEVLRPPETVDGDEQAVSQRLATEARVGLHLRLLVGEGEGEGEVEGGGEGISSLSLLFRLFIGRNIHPKFSRCSSSF